MPAQFRRTPAFDQHPPHPGGGSYIVSGGTNGEGGKFVAGRALRPLHEVAYAVSRVSTDNPRSEDEVQAGGRGSSQFSGLPELPRQQE